MFKKANLILFLFLTMMILTACPGKKEQEVPYNAMENEPNNVQNTPMQLPTVTVTPTPKAKEKDSNEISSYATEILNKDENRVKNIKIAADELNHTVLEPGEVFSFNSALGKRTDDKGYEEAPILKGNGQKGKGIGGGICQISSTMYNAALKSDMEIIERHRHSEPVPYVPEGKDATVVYNSKDLRFKNTKDYPVEILVSVSEDEVTVRFLKKID